MIAPNEKEIENKRAILKEKESAQIEELIDSEIISKYQFLNTQDGDILISVSDEMNYTECLSSVLEKYRFLGWKIEVSRSWSAKFVWIKISIEKK